MGALKAQLRLAREVYNALRRADIDFHRRNGRGLTFTELRQLALDLRKRSEYYQRLRSQVAQGIADRFRGARRRFLEGVREGVRRARIREGGSDAGRRGLRAPGPRLGGRSRSLRAPQHAEEGRVGATRGACGAPPPAHGRGPRVAPILPSSAC